MLHVNVAGVHGVLDPQRLQLLVGFEIFQIERLSYSVFLGEGQRALMLPAIFRVACFMSMSQFCFVDQVV